MCKTKSHWETVYQTKSPLTVSWYQKEPSVSLQLIHHTQTKHDAPIIDVGGGASVLIDYLSRDGHTNLAVLDIAPTALAYAQNRLGDEANNIEWFATDVTAFISPHPFSIWHDRAVFHFLTDKTDRQNYIEVMKHSLLPNGHIIIAAFSIGGPTKCSGLDIIQYDAKKIAAELGNGFKLVEQINEVHITPTAKEQLFTYFRFIKKS
ncbi:MAG: SAM-dependent methyltransferase [Methylophaga sp.]|nr:MAG: SAM-dependent methyltransferase [Methylophaga sp.]